MSNNDPAIITSNLDGDDHNNDAIPAESSSSTVELDDNDVTTQDATTTSSSSEGTSRRSSLQAMTQQWGTRVKESSVELGHRVQDTSSRLWSSTQRRLSAVKRSAAAATTTTTSTSEDVLVDSMDEALSELKRMMQEQRDKEPPPSSNTTTSSSSSTDLEPNKWDFPYTPLQEFDATMDDFLTAFCKWSTQDVEDDVSENHDTSPTTTSSNADATGSTPDNNNHNHASGGIVLDNQMNITKAFVRLQSYVQWMHVNRSFFHNDPLTVPSIAPTARRLNFLLTHDIEGRLVWWMDFARIDLAALQAKHEDVQARAIIRYMAWLTHLCLLDSSAQDNGLIVCEDLNRLGLWTVLHSFPAQVSHKNHRLTLGVLPLKMKRIYVLRAGSWMQALLKFMKPFMSVKMRRRMIILQDEVEIRTQVINVVGGVEYVPENCCGLHGSLSKDLVFGKYIPDGVGVLPTESTKTTTGGSPSLDGISDDDL